MGEDEFLAKKLAGRPFNAYEQAIAESVRELATKRKGIDERDVRDILNGVMRRVAENTKHISSADMQDGKRYRVMFEGTAGVTEWGDRPFKHIGFCINEIGYWLNPEEISGASRIEEIGDNS